MALFGSSDKNKEGAKPAQPNFVNQGQGPQPPQQPVAQPPQPAHAPAPPQAPQSPQSPSLASDAKSPPPIPPTSSAKPIVATLKDVEQSVAATQSHASTHADPRAEALASIGRGSKVSGKLHFEGTVRIDGTVEGELSAGDLLQIGDRAVVNAQISGTVIVIRGHVTGDVNARKRVELRASGKLHGNVTTPSLVIDDGVTFEGHCSMGGEKSATAGAARK